MWWFKYFSGRRHQLWHQPETVLQLPPGWTSGREVQPGTAWKLIKLCHPRLQHQKVVFTSCLALARPIAAPTVPTATPAPRPRPASTRTWRQFWMSSLKYLVYTFSENLAEHHQFDWIILGPDWAQYQLLGLLARKHSLGLQEPRQWFEELAPPVEEGRSREARAEKRNTVTFLGKLQTIES